MRQQPFAGFRPLINEGWMYDDLQILTQTKLGTYALWLPHPLA